MLPSTGHHTRCSRGSYIHRRGRRSIRRPVSIPARLIPLLLLCASAPALGEEPPPASDADSLRREIDALRETVTAQQGQIEALETAAADAAAADAEPPPFRIYGWIDAGIQKTFVYGNESLYGVVEPTRASTFVLGNINLYFDIQPVERWSALVEVRLTTAPDGSDFAGTAA